MRQRTLGRTGLQVSEIGYGAWGIGGALWTDSDDAQSLAALRAALQAGCTFIDTALSYGDGHSEGLVRRALEGWKGEVVVATKVPPLNRQWPAQRGLPLADVFPAAYVRRCAETSAVNLGRPIDLLQFHVWLDDWLADPDWPAVLRELDELRSSNTVRFFGASIKNHDPDSVMEAVGRWEGLAAVQVIYNIFDPTPAERLFPLCRERGIGIIARVPLDEGGLTGAIAPSTTFPPGDYRAGYFAGDRPAQVAERVARLLPVVKREAATLVEGALRFCLSHPAVSTVIPGMRTEAHARANCAAGDKGPLSGALLAELARHAWPRDW